ncbi:outer membrane protein assembly factor BamB family protein [Halalkalicoccus ordinarius]|uniref:outer membrane protein assembly factor BamB family protein n=1 Tax=Halalkalicoccus ordinarius TaxID=3116651 RepID=UPI00300EEDA7
MSESEPDLHESEEATDGFAVSLGDPRPAGSRHMWQRSAVTITDGRVIAGTVDGRVSAFPIALSGYGDEPEPSWTATIADEYAVSLEDGPEGTVAVGGRGEGGIVAAIDATTGERRWSYRSADDLGEPQKESLFFLPYVVSVATDGERIYAAARRYERDGGERSFRSAVYAFDPDGDLVWTYRADASPIAIDLREGRLAVAYNRCPGDHRTGLVVLDTETGDPQLTWDPGCEGDRRVGDASLLADGVAVASHGDYRGYRLDETGRERWSVDLARPTEVGEETLYAYPNHVHATGEGVAFVTGNTYPEEGREAEGRHPHEHTITAFTPDGTERWHAPVGGWVSELAAADGTIATPGAQRFRDRDPDSHGLRRYDLVEGPMTGISIEGVVTAAAMTDRRVAVIEEPVEYHDGDAVRGGYRLHVSA